MIGPFPEPVSGVSLANQVVKNILSEDSYFEVDFINFDVRLPPLPFKEAFITV